MIKSRKIVAMILGVVMLVGGASGTVIADETNDTLLNLLGTAGSRLVLEDYKALAIAKEDTDIVNELGEIVGRLEKDDAADIIDLKHEEMKYQIVSGDVKGYVSVDVLLREKAAEYRAIELLRQKSGSNELKYDYTTYLYDNITGKESFIVTVKGSLDKAAAVEDKEEVEEAVLIKENAESKKEEETRISKRNIKYTKKDIDLLAAIVQCEVGGCSNELQKAVANVVLNRVEDKRFPGTIEKVIYAKRQFSPARNGRLSKVLKNGANKSCIEAVKKALNGDNNVEGYLYFDGKPHKSGYLKMGSGRYPVYFWKTPW